MAHSEALNAAEAKLPGMSLKDAASALLKHHSVDIDSDLLIEGLPVSNGELSDALLDRAAARFGYEIIRTDKRKIEEVTLPCCIKLTTGHYAVVIDRVDDDLAVLDADQPSAYRTIPVQIIENSYAGYAFQMLPSTDLLLERHTSGKDHRHWFWGRIFLQRQGLTDVIVASLVANILAMVTSLFALQVFDRVIPGQSEPTLWVLASGVGLAILFEAALRIGRAKLVDQLGKKAEIDITSDLFTRMLGMKLDKRPASPGSIVHMVREFSSVKEFFTNAAVGVVADLPFAFIFLLMIYGIAGDVVWIIVIGGLLIVLPNLILQGRLERLSKEAMGGMSSASRILTEASYGLEAVKTTRSETMFQRQWEEIIALNALKTTEQRAIRAFLTYWATSIQQATYVLSVVACVYMIFAGGLSTGAIMAVGILTTRTLSPISQLSQALSSWQNMKTALNALEALMSSQQERSEDRTYIRRPRLEGSMGVEKLRYAHPGEKTAVIDIGSLKVNKGTRLALLGANGSGKSTLLRLLSGLLQPSEGEILVDGLDLRQVDPADLRRNIGFLPQEVQMFRGSLRDNLSSGSQHRSDDDILDALKFAGLGDFITHHPQGLDLTIQDGGAGLSIGQKQSIGLARIYLQDPSVILLDEPTSALDQNLENTIVSRIGKWVGSRTCIVATHRPQILSEVTHVAVLQQGRIVLHGERDATLRKLMTPPTAPKLEGQK